MPQGSILGSTLLLLYDLKIYIQESKIILFADDTNILVRAEKGHFIEQEINRFMNNLPSGFYVIVI